MILECDQLPPVLEWIRVTAEYSNAVLVAVMPHISEVAGRLDLPVPRPLTLEHVEHCRIAPRRALTVEVSVRDGWIFMFNRGYVETVQSRNSYFMLQEPGEIPKFYGQVRMKEAEAIELGRAAIRQMGVALEDVFAEQTPRVRRPWQIGTNWIPRYRIEWLDPRHVGPVGSVDLEVNADARRVERLRIFSKSLERPSPDIAVAPERDTRQPVLPGTNPAYALKLAPIALAAIDHYTAVLSLPIPRHLGTNHVARLRLSDNGGWPHAEFELANGWRFIYRNSMVNGFYAPDNLFHSDGRAIRVKDFEGERNLSVEGAITLVRQALARLHYPTNAVRVDFPPQIREPTYPSISRIFLSWWREDAAQADLQSKVEAEVDLTTGTIKSLYADDKLFWNNPPPIDVPLTLSIMSSSSNPAPISVPTSRRRGKPPFFDPPRH